MPPIVLLTDPRYTIPQPEDWYSAQIYLEERLVQEALVKRDRESIRVAWSEANYPWQEAAAAVFRSTWDYFHLFAEFSNWLDRVEGQTKLINSARLVRWNADKHYLADLERAGIRIPRTIFFERGSDPSLTETFTRTHGSAPSSNQRFPARLDTPIS